MNQPKHSPSARGEVTTFKDKLLDYEFSRRQLIIGGAVAGGIIACGGGAYLFNSRQKELGYSVLQVSQSDVIKLDSLELVEDESAFVKNTLNIKLPYNTLVWQDDETICATLQPTETGSPLTKATIIDLSSGRETTLLEKAVTQGKGFEIFEFRANSNGAIWVESNILTKVARVLVTANFAEISTTATQVLELSSEYLMPSVAISDSSGYIQVTPADTSKSGATSKILQVSLSGGDTKEIITSKSAFACNLEPYADGIAATPRSDVATSSYELVAYNTAKGEVEERITLPTSMTPQDVAYGATGFSFTFSGKYDYGDGISSLGTYAPTTKGSNQWVNFERTPSCPPAWLDNNLVVKSSTAIAIIDAINGRYTTLTPPDGADTYGLWLCTSASGNRFTTLANIDITNVKGDTTHECQLNVWQGV